MFDEQPIAAGAVGGDGEDAQVQMFQDGLFSGGEVFAFGASHPRSAAFTPHWSLDIFVRSLRRFLARLRKATDR